MNLEQKDWLLIQRYVTGNASTEESKKIEEWLTESDENQQLLDQLKGIWDQTPPEEFDVDVQHAWEQFSYRNQKKARPLTPIAGRIRKKSALPVYVLRVAAVILVTLFAGLFAHYQMNVRGQLEPDQASLFNVLEELETAQGEKARVTFSDGTRVILNSASSIQFPKEFHGSTREVYLEGEAYFEVAHNQSQPFIVHSQDAIIEVLGTEFNVRGWSEDPDVEVIVRGGKVSVQSASLQPDDRTDVILTEGFKTDLVRGENPTRPVKVDPLYHLLWTSGGIYFDNASFSRVVRDLERRFNINITVSDTLLADVPYTGTFQYADLDEVLSVIAASMEVGYSREGPEVIFY